MLTIPHEGMEDAELARLAKAGGPEAEAAAGALLARYSRLVLSLTHGVLHDPEDARDAAQEAFLSIAVGLRTTWSGGEVKSWMAKCACSAAWNTLRSLNRSSRPRSQRNRMEVPMPEETLEKKEIAQRLRLEIGRLPEHFGEAIALYYLAELPVEEIANRLGISAEACKQRLARGRDRLRQALSLGLLGIGSACSLEEMLGIWSTGSAAKAQGTETQQLGQMVKCALEAAGRAPVSSRSSDGRPLVWGKKAATIAGVAALIAALFAWQRLDGAREKTKRNEGRLVAAKPLLPEGVNRSADLADQGHQTGQAAKPAQTRAGPGTQAEERKWQPLRYLAGRMTPLSVAQSGKKARILVRLDDPPRALGLYESEDGGIQFHLGPVMREEGFRIGVLALASSGEEAILALRGKLLSDPKLPKTANIADLVGNLYFAGVDWVPRTPAGLLGPAQPIWKAEDGEWFGPHPQLFLTGDGASWAFAVQEVGGNSCFTRVARGRNGGCPVPLATGFPILGCASNPAAWASSSHTAGLVAPEGDRELVHHGTRDGGVTWQKTPLHLALEQGSGEPLFRLRIYSLERAGSLLQLLFEADYGDPLEGSRQLFTISSPDLGVTWSRPLPALEKKSIAITKGEYFVMNPQLSSLENSLILVFGRQWVKEHDSSWDVTARLSKDGGQTWQEWSQPKVNSACFRIGSDGRSAVLAWVTAAPGQPRSGLLVQSFAPGNWARAGNLPEWVASVPVAAEPQGPDF